METQATMTLDTFMELFRDALRMVPHVRQDLGEQGTAALRFFVTNGQMSRILAGGSGMMRLDPITLVVLHRTGTYRTILESGEEARRLGLTIDDALDLCEASDSQRLVRSRPGVDARVQALRRRLVALYNGVPVLEGA